MDEIKWENEEFVFCGDTMVISEVSVLESAAGWYIGRLCKTIKCADNNMRPGCIQPYYRLSGYMSYDHCVKLLKTINN